MDNADQMDGFIFMIDMKNNVLWTAGHGKYKDKKYVDFASDVYDEAMPYLRDRDFYGGANAFLTELHKLENLVVALIHRQQSARVSRHYYTAFEAQIIPAGQQRKDRCKDAELQTGGPPRNFPRNKKDIESDTEEQRFGRRRRLLGRYFKRRRFLGRRKRFLRRRRTFLSARFCAHIKILWRRICVRSIVR